MKHLDFECSVSELTDFVNQIKNEKPDLNNLQVLAVAAAWIKEQTDGMVKKGKKYSASIGQGKLFGGIIDFTATSGDTNKVFDAVEFDTLTFFELGFSPLEISCAITLLTAKAA